MGHFAEVIDGIVTRVIVAEQEFINSGAVGNPANWVKTSYNTYGGKHSDEIAFDLAQKDKAIKDKYVGKTQLRKNYAGIGYMYDKKRDAFIPPKHYNSWILNEETCLYEAPILMPKDGIYNWNEEIKDWIKLK